MSTQSLPIILLYNSYSGKGKGIAIAKSIQIYLDQNNIQVLSYINDWPQDLLPHCEIWLIGGDGTLNYFINKYGEIKNNITLFPGGTGNDFHWHLYGKLSIENQILFALNAPPKTVDVARCNDKYFINMVGLGFDGAVLKNIDTVKWIGGHLAYLIAVIKNILTYKESPINVTIDGHTTSKKLLICIIANAPRTGGGFYVSPNSQTNDGLLNWITCQPLSLMQRLLLLPKVEKGKHLNESNVSEKLLTHIDIKSDDIIYYQLDGELMQDTHLSIEVIPAALNFRY